MPWDLPGLRGETAQDPDDIGVVADVDEPSSLCPGDSGTLVHLSFRRTQLEHGIRSLHCNANFSMINDLGPAWAPRQHGTRHLDLALLARRATVAALLVSPLLAGAHVAEIGRIILVDVVGHKNQSGILLRALSHGVCCG